MIQSNSVNPSTPRELSAGEIAHVSGGDGGYLGSGNRSGMLGSGTRSEDDTGLVGSGGGSHGSGG